MAKKPAKPPKFLSSLDGVEEEDIVAGGGVPDDDGMIYLRRSKKPVKGKRDGKGKKSSR
jgi:hypothetical protein